MRIIQGSDAARADLLRRAPLEETQLSPEGKRRIRALFGEELTPQAVVERIIAAVRARGDDALLEYTHRIDGVQLNRLEVSQEEMKEAERHLDTALRSALNLAAERVRRFHEKQRQESWIDLSQGGMGQILHPIERVGVYVPGGRVSYPSTVLMTAIPAQVAGVKEIVLATPPGPEERLPAALLTAASLSGVDRVFQVGGAQAIAALAYGTQSIPRVDKIVGPGNIFVQLAKKAVYGLVGVDALAGPTETLIIADETANASLCAADLLAQAEHDPEASAILLTTSQELAERVQQEVERQLSALERRQTCEAALEHKGGIVVVASLEEAIALANEYAPEHLCLMVCHAWSWLGQIRNAGGIFLGESSPEALGDYTAGPSHVMPTSRTARFSSPLSVYDFMKVTSLVALDKEALRSLGPAAAAIARAEGLTAHARALEMRIEEGGPLA